MVFGVVWWFFQRFSTSTTLKVLCTPDNSSPQATAEQGNPRATAEQGSPQVTAEQGSPQATAEQGSPRATAEQGSPRATAEQDNHEATAEQGSPQATAEQGSPRATAEEDNHEATAEQGSPRATAEQGSPRATAEQGNPRATAEQGSPRATAEQGSHRATAEQGNPERSAGTCCCGGYSKKRCCLYSIVIALGYTIVVHFLQLLSFHVVYIILGAIASPSVTLSVLCNYVTAYLFAVVYVAVILKYMDKVHFENYVSLNFISCILPLFTGDLLLIVSVACFTALFYHFTVAMDYTSQNEGIKGVVKSIFPSILAVSLGANFLCAYK